MALMLIPLILLYEFGIWLSRMALKRRPEAGSAGIDLRTIGDRGLTLP